MGWREDSCDSAGDVATLACLWALFWPLVAIAGAVIILPGLLFEGIGRLLTIGLSQERV